MGQYLIWIPALAMMKTLRIVRGNAQNQVSDSSSQAPQTLFPKLRLQLTLLVSALLEGMPTMQTQLMAALLSYNLYYQRDQMRVQHNNAELALYGM